MSVEHEHGAPIAARDAMVPPSWRGVTTSDVAPGLNISYEAVDRHVDAGRGQQVALRCLRRSGEVEDITYESLRERTNRFANVLADLGVGRGERVFVLAGRVPELYTAVLGTLKHGAVVCTLFSSFGPEPIQQRLERGDGIVLVTTSAAYRKKIASLRDRLPALRHVLLIDGDGSSDPDAGVQDLAGLLEDASDVYDIGATDPDEMALLHFTSGTTGMPKGVVHAHRAVAVHHDTARSVLDLRPGDTYWCTADPGWVTGMSYGIVAPLTVGATCIVDERPFDARRWYALLEQQRVNVWYTAPTAIRMLMRAGDEVARGVDLSALRHAASVGEPLDRKVVEWGADVLGHPIHDTWWQTETGGIMIANTPASGIRRGSIGRPVPGIDVALVRVDGRNEPVLGADGEPELLDEPDLSGMIALRAGWPSMFLGYLHDPDRSRAAFAGEWYLSGDLATVDADGWYWFVGRADDVIKTAGHLVGPFEVERVLLEHPAVLEAGVIGVPDEVAGSVIKAYVVLRPGVERSEELVLELLGFARRHLGAAVSPRSIDVVATLPHTRSGKIMRRLLRSRELGLPDGDLSTLEDDTSTGSDRSGGLR